MFLFQRQIIMKNASNEFLIFMMKLLMQVNQWCQLEAIIRSPEALFKQWDKNKDGKLTEDELRAPETPAEPAKA